MHPNRIILVYQLFFLTILCSETVKIGISKPLPTTTTLAPSTTVGITTEDSSTEATNSYTSLINKEVKTTSTMSPTSTEWPEFPPKKTPVQSNNNTIEKPLTTTLKPSTTTINTIEINNNTFVSNEQETALISSSKWPTQEEQYCFCDLTADTCDINCCCDRDCSSAAIKVFRCLLKTINNFGEPEGRFDDFKFQHGMPPCEENDGWLCVFRTYKPIVKEKVTYYLKDSSRFYKWPNLLLETEDIESREFYKFGDLLRIIHTETKDIQNFDLPSSFESPYCHIQESIYHLEPTKRSCLISSYENLKEHQNTLLQFEENYKIIKAPIVREDIDNIKNLDKLTGNINIYKCYDNEQKCIRHKQDNTTTENYILIKVKVNILHNFTHIQEVVMELWFKDTKEDKHIKSNDYQHYWLSYQIDFFNKTLKEFNSTKNNTGPKLSIVAGPLGYLPGNPVIISRLVPQNKSQPFSAKNQVLNYFSINKTESNTLTLLTKENGECKHSKYSKDFISYGINVAKYCKIKMANNSVIEEQPSKTNFTEICLNLQQHIHDQLFGPDLEIEDLSLYFISKLGKPQNVSSKWLQLQVYSTDFDSIIGQYLHETNTFVCRNILLSLTYEFHIATFTMDNVPLQNIINHAALHLAERHDLEFSLNENLEVPITMTVRFFNTHEKAVSAGFSHVHFNLIFFIILIYIYYI